MPRALFVVLVTAAVGIAFGAPVRALPDAAIGRLQVEGSNLRAGDRVAIEVDVVNRGRSTLPPAPVVLSINGEQHAEWMPPAPLEPGERATWALTWRAERGSHLLVAAADPLNDVSEADEANNSSFVNIGVSEARGPSPWPAAATGVGAFLVGMGAAVLFQRLRPPPRPGARYAVRRPRARHSPPGGRTPP